MQAKVTPVHSGLQVRRDAAHNGTTSPGASEGGAEVDGHRARRAGGDGGGERGEGASRQHGRHREQQEGPEDARLRKGRYRGGLWGWSSLRREERDVCGPRSA